MNTVTRPYAPPAPEAYALPNQKLYHLFGVPNAVRVNGRLATLHDAKGETIQVVFQNEREIVQDSKSRKHPRGVPVTREHHIDELEEA